MNPVTRSQLKKIGKGYRKVPVVTSGKYDEPLLESAQINSILMSYLVLPKRSLKEIIEYYPKHETVENGKTVTVYPNKWYIMAEDKRLSQDEIQAAR